MYQSVHASWSADQSTHTTKTFDQSTICCSCAWQSDALKTSMLFIHDARILFFVGKHYNKDFSIISWMANNFYYLAIFLSRCPAVFWSLFIISSIRFFGCSLFALVELVRNPYVSMKRILNHQEVKIYIYKEFFKIVACACTGNCHLRLHFMFL